MWAHLLGVCSMVIEEGCDEDTAIAALLHDAAEDQGGEPMLAEIRANFGETVSAMVAACTDTSETPKPEWRPRKEAYISHLEEEPRLEYLLVPLADKLFNARAIRRDYQEVGEELWSRFTSDRDGVLWYYATLSEVFSQRTPDCRMSDELATVVTELKRLTAEREAIRLWLDDDLVDRAAPQDWVHVTTAWEAIELLETRTVVELSLDHDLGDDERFGRGIDVVDWLAEQQELHGRSLWPRDGIVIHSANPAGRDAMVRAIERYAAKTGEVHRSHTPSGKPRITFS